jgi:hypothetical protein
MISTSPSRSQLHLPGHSKALIFLQLSATTSCRISTWELPKLIQVKPPYNNNNNYYNKAFLSQARWGRLEMKPHMKTSELNPQRKEKGDKGKGEPKNDETGKYIKRDKTHKNQQDLKGHKKRSND